ncbi:MAG: DUF4249 domain-containing protein [Bacteroidales bacterium]|nr:DUF4249 domain-containing protein [Bacteroidales bacterium]
MKLRNLHIVLFSILLLTVNCKEEIALKNDYNPILIVEGKITNEPGPYIIKITQSRPLDDYGEIPYQNCIVTIHESSGISEDLIEIKPGIYITKEDGMQSEIGNKYSISIISPEGKEYVSDYQELLEPIEIQSFYSELIYLENLNFTPNGLPGHQFYADTKDSPNADNYFLWEMVESYQYTADFELYSIFDGFVTLYTNLNELPQYDNLYRCWKTENVHYIYTGETNTLNSNKITRQALHFVGTDTKKLMERYSVLLNQYTIEEDAFFYWREIEKQISEKNSLAVSQPYNIPGNVINVNDPDETVCGFFTVASINQKRIFVDKPRAPFYYETCCIGCIKGPPPVIMGIYDGNSLTRTTESCIDCRSKGGATVKPDFWIDK